MPGPRARPCRVTAPSTAPGTRLLRHLFSNPPLASGSSRPRLPLRLGAKAQAKGPRVLATPSPQSGTCPLAAWHARGLSGFLLSEAAHSALLGPTDHQLGPPGKASHGAAFAGSLADSVTPEPSLGWVTKRAELGVPPV